MRRSLIRLLTGMHITDCTRGFRACNRKVIDAYAHWYPEDYPEPEVILLLHRAGFTVRELDVEMRAGEFGPLLDWLRSAVYAHGRKFTPDELVERVTGSPIGSAAWIAYARHKFGELYALD